VFIYHRDTIQGISKEEYDMLNAREKLETYELWDDLEYDLFSL